MTIDKIVESNVVKDLYEAITFYYSQIPEPLQRLGKTVLIAGGILVVGYYYFIHAYKKNKKY